MSIEEKAKAYDEALERARKYMAKGYDVLMPEIFPELRESEDERIRKNIRLALLSVDDAFWATHGLTAKEAISYLEKQKEQEHICDSAQFDEGFKTGLEIGLRKQKEQKPTATINGEPIPTENHSVDIPLAEWSEEDEKRVKEAIKRIDELEFLGIHCNNVRKVLESIRPSWKPSDQ